MFPVVTIAALLVLLSDNGSISSGVVPAAAGSASESTTADWHWRRCTLSTWVPGKGRPHCWPSRLATGIRQHDEFLITNESLMTIQSYCAHGPSGLRTRFIVNSAKANPVAPVGRLRDREERFRMTVDHAPVGISHTDMRGRWLYVNQRLCEIVGYTREELLQRTFPDITHPDHLAENVALEQKLFAGDIERFSMEKQYIRKDGEPVWVNLTVSLVRDHEGHPAYTIGIVEDITERKQSLEALHNAEKLLAAGRLAATIAHEINNPLAGIFNLVYLLRSDPAMSRASRQLLDTLDVQLQRVADVTKRALTFYRETSAPEPVQVCPILEEVITAFDAQLISADINAQVECAPGDSIMGFPGELRHVFANLLTNAIDALDGISDERSLHVAARLGFDWQNSHRKGIRIHFRDNGCGIPRSSWRTLYDPFFTTKRKANGLGLWVAKGIIEKHGGSIRFRTNTAGHHRGTCFSIFLPYQAPEHDTADPVAAQIGRELLDQGQRVA